MRKRADILAYSCTEQGDVTVEPVGGGRKARLTASEALAWHQWSGSEDFEALPASTRDKLLTAGLVIDADGATGAPALLCDACKPVMRAPHVRWYAEHPDLTILFNTAPMAALNPLIALGPYGSRCWHGIVAGQTIRELRDALTRIFGRDEVVPFLRRLADLGMIQPIPGVETGWSGREELVKEFPAPVVQFRLPQAAQPWYCLWELCTMCDIRCRVCYLPNFSEPGPSRAQALDFCDALAAAGIFYVTLLGGEVLLRDDLESIVRRLREAGVFVKVITNGQSLTPARAARLAAAGLNQVEVSFDGLRAATHDRSRGPGAFARARAALQHVVKSGIPRSGVVVTTYRENLSELQALPEFMAENRVSECYLSLYRVTKPWAADAGYHPLGPEDLSVLRQRIAAWTASWPHLVITLLPDCTCGRTSLVIDSAGGLRVCPFSPTRFGRVGPQPLLDAWRSLRDRTYRSGPLGICAALSERIAPAGSDHGDPRC